MKHETILRQITRDAERDPNIVGLLVFGSVAKGTHTQESDIDIITVFLEHQPTSGMVNRYVGGIKVGNVFFTREIIEHAARTVPYLLHPFVDARLLFDREGTLRPMFDKIREFFGDHPEIVDEWNGHYERFKSEKAQFGREKTNIIDVWNELERRHSGGQVKRRFFLSPP